MITVTVNSNNATKSYTTSNKNSNNNNCNTNSSNKNNSNSNSSNTNTNSNNSKTVPATAFSPLRVFDAGFANTAVCATAVSSDTDTLRYRGYALTELVARSSFLEVAYLLVFGSLPTEEQHSDWVHNVMRHTYIHQQMEVQMATFR